MHIRSDNRADSLVVLDFETTGLSPDAGDRAIEIGAVKLEKGQVTDTFQQLMNPGRRVNAFIEQYTGITNKMLANAAPCDEVMAQFADFIGDSHLLAHNASFDKKFLDAEFARINHHYSGRFACTLLISRRLYQQAPDHKLGTLVRYKNLSTEGQFHRALFDSQMTAKLWQQMLRDIHREYRINPVPFTLVEQLAKAKKSSVQSFFKNFHLINSV
ncbi:PolC-type DNA polymerase III [Thalassotalea aquiviva]|uniref:3'-5' exonuclease n=1 Tax=Thalassotalea aquiviva TaxID=3242415 RepID=UPI00352A6CAE